MPQSLLRILEYEVEDSIEIAPLFPILSQTVSSTPLQCFSSEAVDGVFSVLCPLVFQIHKDQAFY
jgi:hypothetical protein